MALGDRILPVDPAPGVGGVLLGAVVARFIPDVDPDLQPELRSLTHEIQAGQRIPQPRLRHRLQTDQVGLIRSRHRLLRIDDRLTLDLEGDKAAPAQNILAAMYAVADFEHAERQAVMDVVRKGLRWTGPVGPALISHLSNTGSTAGALPAAALADPVQWAMTVLGLDGAGPTPERSAVQRQFRQMLRDAHPDHGAEEVDAARRIADLSEARRILLA